MSTWLKAIATVIALVAAGAGGYWWWQQQRPPASVAQGAPPPEPPPVAAPAPAEPAIRHPIEAVAPDGAASGELPALAQSDDTLSAALVELLGRKNVLTFLQADRFVRNTVATIDNLGREHASPRLWPVVPTAGRPVVSGSDRGGGGGSVSGSGNGGAGLVLAESNAERYAPFVRFASSIDAGRAAAVYVRFYPLFQMAYDELGYPGRYFNDRVVEVIDLLLQTPEPPAPVRLVRTEVKGPLAQARPVPTYEFADPALESRPAGQKILMRMGTQNQRLMKAKLREFRARIALP